MNLRIDYLGWWHLKNDDYEDIKVAKNDSEKVELIGEMFQEQQDQINELKIRLEAK